MPRSRLLASVLFLAACKSAETPAPAVAPSAAPEPAPVVVAPPPPPKVELPPAPALPATPLGLAAPTSPAENPTTPEKAELGWKLFYDKRLSKDGSMACATCHHLDKGFATHDALNVKQNGTTNVRNSPTIANLAWHPSLYWDGRMPTVEACSNAAWKGQLGADPATVAAALNEVPVYKAMFERAFGEPATAANVPMALAAWFRTLQTGNSPWDRFQAGDKAAMGADAQAGFKVFSQKGCVTCHVPPMFTDYDFHAVGLGTDPGRKDATKQDADAGKFKTPSLRNVALTAPYFHDGSKATLAEAIAFMAQGGTKGATVSEKLKPQKLSAKEAKQLQAFLESLSGDFTYTTEPTLP